LILYIRQIKQKATKQEKLEECGTSFLQSKRRLKINAIVSINNIDNSHVFKCCCKKKFGGQIGDKLYPFEPGKEYDGFVAQRKFE